MSLDPQLASMLQALDAGFPPVHTMTGAQARAKIKERFVPNPSPVPVAKVTDLDVPVDDGSVGVRIYRPEGAAALPVLVYAHGGGFVFCGLDTHDGLCRSFANLIPAVVVSVDYRLAPEHGWPAAAEDVYAVTRWVSRHATDIGADAGRIAVGGDSAGGNLAAVTALMARDRGGPELAAQLLVYPVLAADFDTESYRRFGEGFYNSRVAMQWYWDQYVPSPGDRRHPYASPINARLEGLPPAAVVVAGHDPLHDEGVDYAEALESAGVPTVRCHFEGAVHGFMTMPTLDLAKVACSQVSRELAALITN